MKTIATYVTLLLVLALANEGFADFVERSSAFGVNTITLDNATGLEWLDLTQSTNMSALEVEAELLAGGMFFGYRPATADEISVLLRSSGGLPTAGEVTQDDLPLFTEMQRLLGLTIDWGHLSQTWGTTATVNPVNPANRLSGMVSIMVLDGVTTPSSWTPEDVEASPTSGSSAESKSTLRGYWLVKGNFTPPVAPWSWIDCTVDTPGRANGVVVAGDFAYVADSGSGLHVIDISDPTASQTLGIAYLSSTIMELAIAGDFAYMAEFDLLSIIDISNPGNPVQVGSVQTAGWPTGVAVSGNHAFVANNYDFQVVDISDPTTPLLVGNVAPETTTEYWAYGVAVSGNYAFVVGIEGLIVVDITNPEDPVVARTLDFGGGAGEITISGGMAYVCASDLLVIDISDPVNPQLMSQVITPGTAVGVSVSGSLAYVGDSRSGLQIVDISDPFGPQLLGGLDTPGSASDLCVSGDYAFVADGSFGLQIIQVTNELGPDCNSSGVMDIFEMADHPSIDWNNDGLIDNCQQGQGIADVPSNVADQIVLHDAWPNPFNPQVAISFELPRQTRATLGVYDMTGRLVRTLANGVMAKQGRNEFFWNGRDEAGLPVSSGVYLYILEAGKFSESKRMVLLK